MVSEAFKQNIKKYGREIDAKLVFDDFTLGSTDIIDAEKIFDTDFMMTTMQEVNGKLNGLYNLKDKQFTFLFGVKPKLETTNQIDKDFSGLQLVGDDLVQTMVVEPGKIYNLRLDVKNVSHKPIIVAGFEVKAGERRWIEDTYTAGPGQTTFDLVISGESLHFVTHDPHFELDNRFILHEYIDLGTFNIVEHERVVDAKGDDKTTFKAFDNMIKTHDMYDLNELGITFPITVGGLATAIATRCELDLVTGGVNLEKIIDNDKWTDLEDVTYRNILDEIAQATGTGLTVYGNTLTMKEFNLPASNQVNEDDIFSLKLKDEFGPVNIINLKNSDTKEETHYPANWQSIAKNSRYEIAIEDNQIMLGKQGDYAPSLLAEASKFNYYPFEADTQGFGYLGPLEIVEVVDLDGKAHPSVIMHSTLKIDNDVKEAFKALPPVMHKNDNKVVKPEERKLNRVQTMAQTGIDEAVGSVSRIKLGQVEYQPINGIVSLPAYPDVSSKADKTYVDSEISKIPQVDISGKADKTYVDNKVKTDVPADAVFTDTVYDDTSVKSGIANKVNKVAGKGLSTNDYDDLAVIEVSKVKNKADKSYVDNKVKTDVPLGAKFTDTIVDISNKADKSQVLTNVPINAKFTDTIVDISGKADKNEIPTKNSQLTNDSKYITETELGNAGYGDMLKSQYANTTKAGYVDKAINADKVNGKTVEVNVPANAKFTDTIELSLAGNVEIVNEIIR